MSALLKSKTVPEVGDVTIRQLSGLARYDFMDYCSELARPEEVTPPNEGATQEENVEYLTKLDALSRQWSRFTFMIQSRLVAYGLVLDIEDIQERHDYVLNNLAKEQIEQLHREVALLSGMPLPEDTNTDIEPEETQSEPVDPKV